MGYKTRLLIFVLLSALLSCGDKIFISRIKFIDPEIEPIVNDFKEDCNKYGWDPGHVDKLSCIAFNDNISNLCDTGIVLGRCYSFYKTIFINPSAKSNKLPMFSMNQLRKTVYHELGHWYGMGHESYGIMASGNPIFIFDWQDHVKSMMSHEPDYSFAD